MRGKSKTTPVLLASGALSVPGMSTISIQTETWLQWLETATTFYYQGEHTGFTVRPEKRRRRVFWYAFKKIDGKTRKKYIGNSQALTLEALQMIEKEWHSLLETTIDNQQVTQRSDFPKDILYALFEDEKPSAYQAWENPETRIRARAGLYFIRHGEWLFEIQKSGKVWHIFAFSGKNSYTEDIDFDNLKQASYVASTMNPR